MVDASARFIDQQDGKNLEFGPMKAGQFTERYILDLFSGILNNFASFRVLFGIIINFNFF